MGCPLAEIYKIEILLSAKTHSRDITEIFKLKTEVFQTFLGLLNRLVFACSKIYNFFKPYPRLNCRKCPQ